MKKISLILMIVLSISMSLTGCRTKAGSASNVTTAPTAQSQPAATEPTMPETTAPTTKPTTAPTTKPTTAPATPSETATTPSSSAETTKPTSESENNAANNQKSTGKTAVPKAATNGKK